MLIVLDRDGVINTDLIGEYVSHVTQWESIPGSIEAIARLTAAGHRIAVATNQAGLSRGLVTLDDLEEIHAHMIDLVEAAGGQIAGVFYCPHHPDEHCACRKPAPGLLDAIERELALPVAGAVMVGDKLSDLQLAEARGCRPVLVRTGYGQRTENQLSALRNPADVVVFDDLASAVSSLLS